MTVLPAWLGAVIVCVPNLALGVLLLVFRRPVSSFLAKASRRISYAHPAVPMALVIVAGILLIVVAGGGLVSAGISALSS